MAPNEWMNEWLLKCHLGFFTMVFCVLSDGKNPAHTFKCLWQKKILWHVFTPWHLQATTSQPANHCPTEHCTFSSRHTQFIQIFSTVGTPHFCGSSCSSPLKLDWIYAGRKSPRRKFFLLLVARRASKIMMIAMRGKGIPFAIWWHSAFFLNFVSVRYCAWLNARTFFLFFPPYLFPFPKLTSLAQMWWWWSAIAVRLINEAFATNRMAGKKKYEGQNWMWHP